MLPGSYVERKRSYGQPKCRCADGNSLRLQNQLSVLVDGKPRAFNIPAVLVDQVREKAEMRLRFDEAATSICSINLKRLLSEKAGAKVRR